MIRDNRLPETTSRHEKDLSSYRADHSRLLTELTVPPVDPDRHPRLGGVVVPTSRNLRHQLPGLELAAAIAAAEQCPLVIVVSQEAQAEEVPKHLKDSLGDDLIVIDVSAIHPNWHPELRTRRHSLERLHRSSNDVGLKRNLGLSIAMVSGMSSILFLDDDVIADPEKMNVEGAVRALDQDEALRAIAWTLDDFPDNSVAGHVRRIVPGLDQEVFVGGGAMLVTVAPTTPFFPNIYNEDWLFLIATAWTSGNPHLALGRAGDVDQLLYNPFRLRRARSEEAGEIIGECLLNQLETEKWPPPPRTPEYWQVCRDRRAEVLDEVSVVVAGAALESDQYQPLYRSQDVLRLEVLHALEAARAVNQKLEPDWLATYVQAWVDDVRAWRLLMKRMFDHDLDDLPVDDPLAAALRQLGTPRKLSIKVWLRRRGLSRQPVA